MTKKALVSWGGWEGHTPDRSAAIIGKLLNKHDFEVRIAEGTAPFSDPDLGRFDLVVPVITMSKIEKGELENLIRAVREGAGLAGFHGTMCDSFRNEPDYQFMTGGQWVAHPGNIVDYRVNVSKPDDPIMNGIEDFDYRSEQYYMHVDPGNEVLAMTRFSGEHFASIEGVSMPVVWKRRFGEGKIFYSSLGHTCNEFDIPEMRMIMERGLLWAAR